MLEHEKKVMLTADEYAVASGILCKDAFFKTHTNYYFDTDDFYMNKKGITCRIRAKGKTFVTTIKNHVTQHPECSVEEDVCENTVFDPEIFHALGLSYQGKLITQRMIVYQDGVCEVALDRNTYLGYTDYELELEYTEEGQQKAREIFQGIVQALMSGKSTADMEAFCDRIGKGKSKSQRFFERKLQGRG